MSKFDVLAMLMAESDEVASFVEEFELELD